MIFANKERYGITRNIFLKQSYIGYLNLCRVKTKLGISIGDATSRDINKLVSIKKCYNEYLERFSLGISIDREDTVQSINIIDNSICNRKKNYLLMEIHHTVIMIRQELLQVLIHTLLLKKQFVN